MPENHTCDYIVFDKIDSVFSHYNNLDLLIQRGKPKSCKDYLTQVCSELFVIVFRQRTMGLLDILPDLLAKIKNKSQSQTLNWQEEAESN